MYRIEFELSVDVFGILLDPLQRVDPYARYADWLQRTPVLETDLGVTFVFGYADCLSILRDRRFSVDNSNAVPPGAGDELPTLIHLDPPDHDRLRRLVQTAFTPRRVELLRARAIALTNYIIPTFAGKPSVDIVEQLAIPVPLLIICDLLGVPEKDRQKIRGWSEVLAKSIDPDVMRLDDVNASVRVAQNAFIEYLGDLFEFRRRSPGDDMLSLLASSTDADRLNPQELYGLAVLLLVAGHETTASLISNGLHAMLSHRDQYARLARGVIDPRSAVDELLRFDSPVQMTSRIALEPVNIGGVRIERGKTVVLMLGAANRDPAAFASPTVLDLVSARDVGHIAFGNGLHHCLGAALARAEGEVVLSMLARTYPNMTALEVPPLKDTFVLRGRSRFLVDPGRFVD